MTPRQQRRAEQKLARKAAKRAFKAAAAAVTTTDSMEPATAGLISPAKVAANVANAQLSTGPVTTEGKAIVSQNATKHGLTGTFNKRTGPLGTVVREFKVLPCESQSDFDRLLAGFLHSQAPASDDEIEMVHQMAEALWLSRRSVRLQNKCFAALESGTHDEQQAAHKLLALYIRYQTTHDRTFTRYSTELRKRRNERARAERGFVSQKLKEAAERRRQETHLTRQALHNAKQQAQEIRNRHAAAKAEALELRNRAAKLDPQTVPDSKNHLAAA